MIHQAADVIGCLIERIVPKRRVHQVHPETLPVLNQTIRELKCEFSNIVKREIRATQDWFYDKAIPKAIRVAQRETFNLLRNMGVQQPKQSSDIGKYVATKEQGNPNEAKAQIIAELVVTMKTIATASENIAIASILQGVSLELDTLGRKFYTDEIDFQMLEETLNKLEQGVATTIWDNTESALKETLLRKGEKELQKYEQRMDTVEYRQIVQKHATYALFDHYQIPRFSLFYL